MAEVGWQTMMEEGFQGTMVTIYLGRGRGLSAQARLPPPPQEVGIPCIRRQPHTPPCCLALRSQSQSQSPATPPIPLKIITILHPTPIFSLPHLQTLAHAKTYAPVTNCQPHPLLMQANQSPHQSQKTLMSPSLCFYNTFLIPSLFLFFKNFKKLFIPIIN